MKKLICGVLVVLMTAVTPVLSAKSNSTKKSGKCEVKNLIYMIGDGMGLAQVSMLLLEGKYLPTAFNRSENIALISTYSANNRVTDSAAAGTALASGHKTNNGVLGQEPDGTPCVSIMERAGKEGYQTGLVVTVYLQHATPGAFYAHVPSRNDLGVISEQFVESGVDVALGGGKKFLSEGEKEGKNLIEALEDKDYKVVYDMEDLESVDRGKVVGLFSEEYMPTVLNGRDPDYLKEATEKALEILSNNCADSKKGFMLMVEGSQIDIEGHANNAAGILEETRDFAQAVGAAMDFADRNPGTLVVVTADHETSGLSITSNKTDFTLSDSGIGYDFGTTGHTGIMVPVYLYGTGAEQINGIMDNTDLPKKLAELMRLK